VELVQARLVTDDVAGLAAFYAGLVQAEVPLNEYYVEVPAGPGHASAAAQYSVNRRLEKPTVIGPARPPREVVLDFQVADVDAEYPRISALGVGWVLPPTTQPWGSRSMVFNDPEGNLVNVFSRPRGPT